MQTLNAAHLANLREALGILSRGLKQNSVLLESAKLSIKVFEPLPETAVQPQAQVLPVLKEAVKEPQEPVILSEQAAKALRLSSSGYFCRLPWNEVNKPNEAGVRGLFKPIPLDTAPDLPLEESKPVYYLQEGGSYFSRLSWHKAIAIINRERVLKPSGAYFKEIFGGGEELRATDAVSQLIVETTLSASSLTLEQAGTIEIPNSGGGYFQALPWDSRQPPALMPKPIGVPEQPDAGWMGQLATQSALRTAERLAAEKQSPLHSISGFYFQQIFMKPKQGRAVEEPGRTGISRVRGKERTGLLATQIQTDVPVLEKSNKRYFQTLPWN